MALLRRGAALLCLAAFSGRSRADELQANGEPVHFTTSLTGLNGRVVVATPLNAPDVSIMQLQLLSDIDPLAVCNGAAASAGARRGAAAA